MDAKRMKVREQMAAELRGIATGLSDMYQLWLDNDLPSDALAEGEYPFHLALEEMIAEVHAACARIEQVNYLGTEKVTLKITASDFVAMTEELAGAGRSQPKLQALFQQHPLWGDHR